MWDVMLVNTVGNALLCTSLGAAAIATFGDAHERQLVAHEAYCGVRRAAESASRMAADMIVLAPLPIVFSLPFQAVTNFAGGLRALITIGLAAAWAISPVAYACTVLAPHNATILTSVLVLVSCLLFAGMFAVLPSALPPLGNALLGLSPGRWLCEALLLVTLVRMPFGISRLYNLSELQRIGYLSSDEAEAVRAQMPHPPWWTQCMSHLFLLGLGARLLTLLLVLDQQRRQQGRRCCASGRARGGAFPHNPRVGDETVASPRGDGEAAAAATLPRRALALLRFLLGSHQQARPLLESVEGYLEGNQSPSMRRERRDSFDSVGDDSAHSPAGEAHGATTTTRV